MSFQRKRGSNVAKKCCERDHDSDGNCDRHRTVEVTDIEINEYFKLGEDEYGSDNFSSADERAEVARRVAQEIDDHLNAQFMNPEVAVTARPAERRWRTVS